MSFSVKNRVAIFEGGTSEDENPSIPSCKSYKRPSTPNSIQSIGPQLLRPATPKGKAFTRKNVTSPKMRASWPWPSEDDNAIPVPQKPAQWNIKSDKRRFSTPSGLSMSSPVILPHKSPMGKSSAQNSTFVLPRKSPKSLEKSQFREMLESPKAKPLFPAEFLSSSPLGFERKDSQDENKAMRITDAPTLKALQEAKSRNCPPVQSSQPNAPTVITAVTQEKPALDEQRDDEGSEASSRQTDQELSRINGFDVAPPEKSLEIIGTVAAGRTAAPGITEKLSSSPLPGDTVSRAERVSQVRSQSPLLRGSRTVSKVSHQEARKALLQAAQRKRERVTATANSQSKEKTEQATVAKEPCHNESTEDNLSKRSEGSAADRIALKAKNVLKIKNSMLFGSTKVETHECFSASHGDIEESCSESVVSTSSRLKNHPAFAARAASPRISTQITRSAQLFAGNEDNSHSNRANKDTAKPFSEELFSSFRHFHEKRPQQKRIETKAVGVSVEMANSQGRPPQPAPTPSPMCRASPKTLKEMMAAGKGISFQTSPMADSSRGRLSMDSFESGFEQDESLHSTSEQQSFDRKWMDHTGQPRYAAPKQSFQQNENGYLSSLSSNTFVSMLSSAPETTQLIVRVDDEAENPLGDMTTPTMRSNLGDITTPTMRSGHSMAHSIVSTSPKIEASGRKSGEFENLLNTPSSRLNSDINDSFKQIPVGVPSQIDEEESTGPSTAGSEPTVDLPGERLVSIEEKKLLSIQTSSSGAEAPPGFVFHDEDSNENVQRPSSARDPVGKSFDERDPPQSDAEKRVEKSSSTKESVSMHSELSNNQTELQRDSAKVSSESPKEGSKSIRSGLSGIQNTSDLEGSTSLRSASVSMRSTKAFEEQPEEPPNMSKKAEAEKSLDLLPPRAQFDTIVEADDEEASGVKEEDQQQASSNIDKPKISEEAPKLDNDADSGRKPMLPANLTINPKSEQGEDGVLNSLSSPASSKSSRWKMKVPTLVKSVLSKASPRNSSVKVEKDPVRPKPTSTSDEDDDIFGGLEDDISKIMGESFKQDTKITPKRTKPRAPPTTNGNKVFYSAHTRKSEPPPRSAKNDDAKNRSVRSEVRGGTPSAKKKGGLGVFKKAFKERLISPRATTKDSAVKSNAFNDRSGTEVVEQQMEHVNSDITSSVLGAAVQKKVPTTPMVDEVKAAELDRLAKTPKTKTTSTNPPPSTTSKTKTPKVDNHSVAFSKGRDTLLDNAIFPEETVLDTETRVESVTETSSSEEEKPEEPPSMFANLSCGFSNAFEVVSKVCHFGNDEEDADLKAMEEEIRTLVSVETNNSSSRLTELEKRVWNEWDKLDAALNKKSNKKSNTPAPESSEVHEKEREVARGKLLEIANSAISSQMTKEGEQSAASASYTTGSSSDSGITGNSSGMTGSVSEGNTSAGESQSYMSGSDTGSDLLSASVMTKPASAPILLSFSQRSLIEKFTKQLGKHGVEVLKLNRRKQWQVRYLTISKEQIALVAHEATRKSGAEVAQCPKALLWLKKFSTKSGGYSLSNIDKTGHGGMFLVSLKDIEVTSAKDLESPFPKKLADKFKDSVHVKLEYEFKSQKRSLEFRCKDNDEAQFLCTCMRVIRDLLKREKALRLKSAQKK